MAANASTQARRAWNYIAFTCVVVSLFAFVSMVLPDHQNSTLETFKAGMSNGTTCPISTELAAI